MTQDKLKPCKCPECQVWDEQPKNIASLIKLVDDIAKKEKINKKINKLPPEKDYIETAGVFWLVWTPQGGNPKYKHSTRESAETESARLAKQHPEREFYVLKCVSKTFAETKVNKVNYE